MKRGLVSFAAGLLFALGLGLSGMTQPEKVLGFLDIAGHWDPSLMFVMGGAVLFGLIVFPRVLARGRPLLAPTFHIPAQHAIDAPLVGGSVLFGIGWGLSGYCPGPAIVSTATLTPGALVFCFSMIAGMVLFAAVPRRSAITSAVQTVATND